MMKLVVIFGVIAAVAAHTPFYFNPAAVPVPSPLGYVLPAQQLYNYRGPLSLAPGQPANILAADGRPLDTLDVNLDRAAHITAKALENGVHALKKRSVTRLAVAPGPIGFNAAVAAGNIGVATPIAVSPTGMSGAIAINPVGIYASLPSGTIGVSTPAIAGSVGISTPFVATSPVGISTGPVAVSAPLSAVPAVVTAPITAGAAVTAPIAAGTLAVSGVRSS